MEMATPPTSGQRFCWFPSYVSLHFSTFYRETEFTTLVSCGSANMWPCKREWLYLQKCKFISHLVKKQSYWLQETTSILCKSNKQIRNLPPFSHMFVLADPIYSANCTVGRPGWRLAYLQIIANNASFGLVLYVELKTTVTAHFPGKDKKKTQLDSILY